MNILIFGRSNLTVHFSQEDHGSCEPSSEHPAFTVQSIPPPGAYDGACYNLAELFLSNSSRPANVSDWTDAEDRNPLNATALNSVAFDYRANYSRIWYQQTNDSMYGTIAPGEMAARQITVYPERDCTQGKGYPPRELGMAPYYSWNCQSKASGSCFSLPEEVKSFYVRSAATFQETWGDGCWDMEARGGAAVLQATGDWMVAAGIIVVLMFVT